MSDRSIPLDLWLHNIVMFCDLPTVLRLSWTTGIFYRRLNDSRFVVEWQERCWFMRRGCSCDRNVFYLNLTEYCDFAYDFMGFTMKHSCDMRNILRHFGRTVPMLMAARADPMNSYVTRTPHLNPRSNPEWGPGICQAYLECTWVVLPRMVYGHVEDTHVRVNAAPRRTSETTAEYDHRRKWRTFHEIPEGSGQPIPDTGFTASSPDRVVKYIEDSEAAGRDPYDPMDDDNSCEGYQAAQWARRMMYESAVGIQQYPLELCLTEEELDDLTENRGADYISRMFLSPRDYDRSMECRMHHGPVYFTGLRYENQSGDLSNWVLSTIGTVNAVYHHMWFDNCFFYLDHLYGFARELANEVQDYSTSEWIAARIAYLEHVSVCNGCTRYVHSHREENVIARDVQGIDFLQRPAYATFHGLVRHALRTSTEWDAPYTDSYLTTLIPCGPPINEPRELDIVSDLMHMCELTSYLVEFAECIGPVTDPRTTNVRRRTFVLYLHSALSMIAFAPTWHRAHSFKPSSTSQMVPLEIPKMNLTHNHRYQSYVRYLQLRTLYHHPDPSVYANVWMRQYIEDPSSTSTKA